MRKEDKGVIISQLADTVKQYGHFYLVDTTAMDAASTSELRRKCFKAGIKLVVVKNSLLHKALMSLDVDYSPLFDSLKGTTSVMFCETANAPAKLLKEYKDVGIFVVFCRQFHGKQRIQPLDKAFVSSHKSLQAIHILRYIKRVIPGITFDKTLSMCLQRIKIFFEATVSITRTGKAIFLIKDILNGFKYHRIILLVLFWLNFK